VFERAHVRTIAYDSSKLVHAGWGTMWTVVGGLGGSLVAVGALTTLSSRNYVLGIPLLLVGLTILVLWYIKHFRD
jgi:hypothetical protein